MKKALCLSMVVVFGLFAYLNLNDPDPVVWVLAYGATAALFGLAAFDRAPRPVIGWYTVALCIWMCTMLPGMIVWFRAGMPSITSEMQATQPHIEVVREFLGLAIAVVALFMLYRTERSHR